MARSLVSSALLIALIATPALPATPVLADPIPASGAPVELLAERGETTEVYANSDGSFTRHEYLRPIWAKTRDGVWARPDATLKRQADGTIAPVASTFPMAFSGGGDVPLAVASKKDKRLELDWPGRLPEPVIAGNLATYSEVLPGVDLEVSAEVDGFTHVLVVKDRRGAANPALRKLKVATRTQGLTLARDEATGGVSARDTSGQVVFGGSTPTMWDGTGREGVVAAAVRRDGLELVPDASLLTNPDATFPIRIDPSWSASRNHWTIFRKEYGGTSYYDRVSITSDDGTYGVLRAGHSNEGATARSMIQFNVGPLAGKVVSSATLRLWHSWSGKDCGNGNYSAGAVNLYQVSAFSSGHTWNNQPGWGSLLGGDSGVVRRTGGGYQGRCPAGNQEFNVTGVISGLANAGGTAAYFGLRAANEGDIWSWKRYKIVSDANNSQNPFLAVNYNSYPNTPDQLVTGSNGACVTGLGQPWLGTGLPTVTARASDPDNESNLTIKVEWAAVQADGTYGAILGSQTKQLPSGTSHTFTLPALADGKYAWRAWTSDAALTSKTFGGWCEFFLDSQRPTAIPGVSSPLYKDDLQNYYGSPGRTATFTFTPSGVTDVAGYEYGWADPPTTYVAAGALGGSVTSALTPPPPDPNNPSRGGQLTLFVRSLDRAKNKSDLKHYTFLIGSASAPVGAWKLNETAGTALADSSGGGHPATLSGGVPGRPGRVVDGDTVVAFDGVDDYAGTTTGVLDTSNSFSVSAWVKMTNTAGSYQTVVSQAGARTAVFYLQKWQGGWTFSLHFTDTDAPSNVHVQSGIAPVAGVWTHLTGVYDRASNMAHLYVNGVWAASGGVAPLWKATGPLWIGQAIYGAVQVDRFAGEISDVRVWDRVLTAKEVSQLGATEVGWWSLDGHGYDDSGYSRDATPSTGVTWAADRKGTPNAAASIAGAGSLHTAGPGLHTDQSYTVAAWVRITDLSVYERTAVAQEGNQVSAFYLGLRQDNSTPQWSMQLRPYDETVCCPWAAVAGPVKQGVWQHLTGVYDAAAGKVRLYVDGVRVKEVTAGTPWRATGPVSIGFGKWAPAGDHWHGGLDDVHIYQGVLPDSEIQALARA